MPRYLVSPPAAGSARDPVIIGQTSESPTDLAFLGRLNEQGPMRSVYLDTSGENVVAIFGKRGSGKSYTLGVLLEGLCTAVGETSLGKCSGHRAVLVLDTLNIFWSTENPFQGSPREQARFSSDLSRLRSWRIDVPDLNVDIWIPRGFRPEYAPAHYRDLSIAPGELSPDDLADLFELDPQRDVMGQVLMEAQEKTAAVRPDFSFSELLEVLETDKEIHEYYADASIRAVRQRVRAIARLPVFERHSTGLGDLLTRGRASILELGDVPNTLRVVVASVLLRRIHGQRSKAANAEKQLALNTRLSSPERASLEAFLKSAAPPAWVMVDEAQNILPSARTVKSSDAVVSFVREGRNHGLSFALSTQQPAAVDQRILAQADTVICHRLTVAQDINRMKDNLKSAEPLEVRLGGAQLDLATWLRSLEPGQALVSNTEFDRTLALEVRPRVTPHAGTGFRPWSDE